MLGIVADNPSNPYPVAAFGFFIGVCTTLVLFGLHIAQIARYYHRFGESDKRIYRWGLIPVVFGLSALHVSLVVLSLHHYFVQGILTPSVWQAFFWGLSAQDLLVPTISFVSHCFFGYRAWTLSGIKRIWWIFYLIFATLTFAIGIAFGVLARIWAQDPWISYTEFTHLSVGPYANALPTVWLSCAACIDGGLTLSLVLLLLREKSGYKHTRDLLFNVVRLTLETVLLTHVIGATLFVLWLTSRTRSNAFWFLIEIIAETYSLSILFTLNSRQLFRKKARPDSHYMIDRQLRAFNSETSESPTTSPTESLPRWRENQASSMFDPPRKDSTAHATSAASSLNRSYSQSTMPTNVGNPAGRMSMLEALEDEECTTGPALTPLSEKAIQFLPMLSKLRQGGSPPASLAKPRQHSQDSQEGFSGRTFSEKQPS